MDEHPIAVLQLCMPLGSSTIVSGELQPRSQKHQADLIQFIYVFILSESKHRAVSQHLSLLP